MSARPLTYGSVCSGIEAATVAWHPLGWKPAFFSEIEPFPRAVLQHHYPSTPLHGDFTTIGADGYGSIELLVGGTPCQSFSIAGLRKGLADERGNLALEYLRLADRLRPDWLVWENVPGVLSSNEGRDFGTFLGGMVELGYGFAYRVLDAQFFGVPQRRRRVFVVGYLGDWRPAAAVLFERQSLSRDPPPRRKTREGVAGTLAARPRGGGGLGTDFDCDGGLVARAVTSDARHASVEQNRGTVVQVCYGGNNQSRAIDLATAFNAHGGPYGRLDFKSETFVCAPPLTSNPYGDHESREGLLVTHSLRADGFDASEDGTGRGTPLVPVSFDCKAGGNTGFSVGTMAGSLRGDGFGGGHSAVAFSCKDDRSDADARSPTLRAMGHDGSHANGGGQVAVATLAVRGRKDDSNFEYRLDGTANALLTPNGGRAGIGVGAVQYASAVRRLTPRECERLQGFHDDYTLISYRGRPAADGPRYKALGNSMAVPCIRWIGERIDAVRAILAAEARAA